MLRFTDSSTLGLKGDPPPLQFPSVQFPVHPSTCTILTPPASYLRSEPISVQFSPPSHPTIFYTHDLPCARSLFDLLDSFPLLYRAFTSSRAFTRSRNADRTGSFRSSPLTHHLAQPHQPFKTLFVFTLPAVDLDLDLLCSTSQQHTHQHLDSLLKSLCGSEIASHLKLGCHNLDS